MIDHTFVDPAEIEVVALHRACPGTLALHSAAYEGMDPVLVIEGRFSPGEEAETGYVDLRGANAFIKEWQHGDRGVFVAPINWQIQVDWKTATSGQFSRMAAGDIVLHEGFAHLVIGRRKGGSGYVRLPECQQVAGPAIDADLVFFTGWRIIVPAAAPDDVRILISHHRSLT